MFLMNRKLNFIYRVVEIDIQMKNLDVPDIEVATSDGVVSSFQDVQVKSVCIIINRIITYDAKSK
jgi:hypothetical protein